MAKNSLIYLDHILDSLSKIKAYTKDQNEGLFLKNPLVQDAVIRNFLEKKIIDIVKIEKGKE